MTNVTNITNKPRPVFSGKKRVFAEPMSRGAYNALRGWQVPADENGEDPGYLVEYLDGGKPNDPRFKGYISWSPAEVFDATYAAEPSGPMAHVDRMQREAAELKDNIDKLNSFVGSEGSSFLQPLQRQLLQAQSAAMFVYLQILSTRINNELDLL